MWQRNAIWNGIKRFLFSWEGFRKERLKSTQQRTMEFVNQTQLQPPFLLERDHESVIVAWIPPHVPLNHYELEMSHEEDVWTTVGATIKSNTVKKKNLDPLKQYRFRVRFEDKNGNWSPFSHPSEAMHPVKREVKLMASPTLLSAESSALTVQWEDVPAASGYRLRFRKDDDLAWHEIETDIKGNKAKKKGLTHGNYYFAVIPLGLQETLEESWTFSLSGGPFTTVQLHPYFSKLLPGTLLRLDPTTRQVKNIDVNELAGKVIGLYFSAHWCGPCRNFTPQLAQLYQQAHAAGKKFEIVFCSCDHSDEEFKSYFTSSMPWTAVDFDDSKREEILGTFRVSGIPHLTILSSSGKVIVENAARHALSLTSVDEWLRSNY